EIAANDAQHEDWLRLLAIDEIEGDRPGAHYSRPTTVEFLKGHPTLVVDTCHFAPGFTERLLEAVSDLDDQMDAVLIQSENFQALTLIQARYRGRVKCTYIDPPYNTEGNSIPYKNDYKHSSFATMMF